MGARVMLFPPCLSPRDPGVMRARKLALPLLSAALRTDPALHLGITVELTLVAGTEVGQP